MGDKKGSVSGGWGLDLRKSSMPKFQAKTFLQLRDFMAGSTASDRRESSRENVIPRKSCFSFPLSK